MMDLISKKNCRKVNKRYLEKSLQDLLEENESISLEYFKNLGHRIKEIDPVESYLF